MLALEEMRGDWRVRVIVAKHKPPARRHEWSVRNMHSGTERFGSAVSHTRALDQALAAIALLDQAAA